MNCKKIFFILLILLLSYFIIEGKFNIKCKKCERYPSEKIIKLNKQNRMVSFADENNKPLETLIKI
jgi:hypothetical protein